MLGVGISTGRRRSELVSPDTCIRRFCDANLRSVLPEGGASFWDPLVSSFLGRKPPVWEFFPSQIQAVRQGLLTSRETFSIQMPTGAGKTALCETLLY